MTYVALGLLAVLAITVATFAGLIRSIMREHARRESLILNQLLHLAGHAWVPAPADAWTPQEDGDAKPGRDEHTGWPEWTPTPEQEPTF